MAACQPNRQRNEIQSVTCIKRHGHDTSIKRNIDVHASRQPCVTLPTGLKETRSFHLGKCNGIDFDLSGPCADNTSIVSSEEKVPMVTSCRWILAYICFHAMILLFAMRASFVMVLVCMFSEEPDLEIEAEERARQGLNRNVTGWDSTNQTGNYSSSQSNETLSLKTIIWDDTTQGFALTAYNYGFIVSPMIGGYLALHSAKYALIVSMALSTIATFLTPWSVGFSPYMTFVLRAVVGISGGVCVPAIQQLWSKWAPKSERGKLTSFTHSGKMVGNVLSFGLTGFLCTLDFLGGWPIVFYGTGILSVVWILVTLYCVHDTPEKHPRISEIEREYILNGLSSRPGTDKTKQKTPWRRMASSLPVWACLICKLCTSYGLAVQTANMPMWIRDVLKFEIKENGLYSALPYIGQFIGSISSGIILDAVSHTSRSVTVVRKITFSVCLLLPGSAIFSLAFLGAEHKALAIVLTVVAATTYSAVPVSLRIIIIEIAPRYAGILMGAIMTIGCLSGIVAPLITSIITSRGTIDEWDDVFFLCGGFYALAALVFAIFGSAKQQPWATDPEMELVVEMDDNPKGLENPGFYSKEISLDLVAANSDSSSDSGVWMGNKMADFKIRSDTASVSSTMDTNIDQTELGLDQSSRDVNKGYNYYDKTEGVASNTSIFTIQKSSDLENIFRSDNDTDLSGAPSQNVSQSQRRRHLNSTTEQHKSDDLFISRL